MEYWYFVLKNNFKKLNVLIDNTVCRSILCIRVFAHSLVCRTSLGAMAGTSAFSATFGAQGVAENAGVASAAATRGACRAQKPGAGSRLVGGGGNWVAVCCTLYAACCCNAVICNALVYNSVSLYTLYSCTAVQYCTRKSVMLILSVPVLV